MRKWLACGIAATGSLSQTTIVSASGWNMPEGVTEVSREIYSLHMLIFWICVAIGVVVFGVMFYSLYRYRHSRGAKAANFHENTVVEIVWTTIPLLILVAMAVPATATLIKMYDASESEIDVMITGHQWRWQYAYLNNEVDFFSNTTTPIEQISGTENKTEHYLLEVDEPLVLPVGRKVRLLMTSADVIHSWWVPELGVKKDAVPGYVNEAWVQIDEPGIYRGQCAELCGKNHGFMPAVVRAVEQDEFETWLAAREEETAAASSGIDREWELDELMERGEKVYGSICAACHMPDGTGNPPTFPALAGATELMNDQERHINTVLNGVSGSAMPAFAGNFNPIELAAVITYERNAWGNDTGDVIQPKDIQALLE